ncbi:glycosyltransferase [Cryobacterium zhongshanensis]|uniref:D-inositol 3-phosphate glycosyltransferase n=1 Tax=Cryobacterium zhongshanensis TaxID=2928153 RepID=A0AA41QV11_9MICO|nr:glycosyltransferase [Cryobacterium zhongshanensis]MCI4658241.1 glycosyltransferase [Cryobacterium zhongshanensis]
MTKQSPLNVLVIGLNFFPEVTGIAPYTSGLVRGLVDRGFNVDVLTAHPHYPEWKVHAGYGGRKRIDFQDGIQITRLPHYVPAKPEGFRRLASELSFGSRVLLAHWGRPDVIVMVSPALFSTAMAMFRARMSRRKPPISLWIQDLYSLGMTETGTGSGAVARLVTWVEKVTIGAASGVVVIHSRFAHYLTEKFGIDPQQIEVIGNWTHLKQTPPFDVAAIRARHGWEPDETIVLHAGNMGVKQALGNVVKAARLAEEQELPVRFVLLGNGSQRESLVAEGQGISRLQFIDSLDDSGFQAALASADVLLVNEKLGVSEMAVPSKLTSYFNAVRPVIAATDGQGVTAGEIGASGGGVVVDAEDPQALVNASIAFRDDPVWAASLAASGMRYRTDVLGQEVAIDRFAQWLRGLALEPDRINGLTHSQGKDGGNS